MASACRARRSVYSRLPSLAVGAQGPALKAEVKRSYSGIVIAVTVNYDAGRAAARHLQPV